MFVGHYAVSLLAKGPRTRVPLWVLFLAAQLTDIGWGVLVITGVEQASLVAGPRGFAGLLLNFMPYTHSLLPGVILWAVAASLVVWGVLRSRALGASLLVGVVVVSHWVLDLAVHRPDLPLYDNRDYVGSGLWDSHPVFAFVFEVGLLVLAFWVYWSRCGRHPGARAPLGMFAAFLVVVQAAMAAAPLRSLAPSSMSNEGAAALLGGMGIAFYSLCCIWAVRLEPTGEAMAGNSKLGLTALRGSGFLLVFAALFVLGMGIWYRVIGVAKPLTGGATATPTAPPLFWNCCQGIFADSVGVLMIFAFLLIVGLTLIGLAKVLEDKPERRRRNRFWWEGCSTFATGIRVVFLIPLSLVCWLGIIAAFDVVWQSVPTQQAAAAIVPGAPPLTQTWNLVFLPIAVIMGWLLLWPSEPEDEAVRVAHLERTAWMESFSRLTDALDSKIRERAEQAIRWRLTAAELEQFTRDELSSDNFMAETSREALKVIADAGVAGAGAIIDDKAKDCLRKWKPALAPRV